MLLSRDDHLEADERLSGHAGGCYTLLSVTSVIMVQSLAWKTQSDVGL